MNVMSRSRSMRAQKGAALMVGLLMLVTLTILGISSMNGTSIQLKMASNSQNKNRAFQVAESVITVTIDEIDYTNIVTAQSFDDTDHPQYNGSEAEVQFVERTTAAGCRGTSFQFSCLHFEIDADGVHVASDAHATLTQGVYRVAPSP